MVVNDWVEVKEDLISHKEDGPWTVLLRDPKDTGNFLVIHASKTQHDADLIAGALGNLLGDMHEALVDDEMMKSIGWSR